MHFFIGTSGYSYPKWKGSFYPDKLPQKGMLRYYAQHFAAVEINNTFYKMPSKSDLQSWTRQVPEQFHFALKAPQTITHFKRLKDAAEPTKKLFQVAAGLKSHLGPILFGLRDNFQKDIARLRAFLKLIPKKSKVAFEFRHESWFDDEVFECLRSKRCALCIMDDEAFPLAPFVQLTNWGYVRLRREKYTKKSLTNWLQKMQSMHWDDAYIFFKHEDTGTGPKFAALLRKVAESG